MAPGSPGAYSNLQPILSQPINWELITKQYDEMIKYATELRLGTAEAEAILRRFTRDNLKHPTYQALLELGKVNRTIFLCRYLESKAPHQEIHEAPNVVERWTERTVSFSSAEEARSQPTARKTRSFRFSASTSFRKALFT